MKRFALLLPLLLLIIAIPIGVYYIGQRQDIRDRAAPSTTLSLSPSSISKQQGNTLSLDVTIDTGENTVSAIELVVNTDPAKVKITGIAADDFFSQSLIEPAFTDSRA
ncbi:MAG: hypothetical protein ACD_36C00114G0003, partial [uncultured bacterium]